MKSSIKASAVNIFCGSFSIILILSILFSPEQGINNKTDTVLKDPRPYKKSVTREKLNPFARLKASKKALFFHDIILEASKKHDVEPALVKAVIMAESGYNPTAISKKGAVGLMQLMPSTANALGVDDLFDPEHNIDAGVRYLRDLLNQFKGDISLALAAYNAGSRKVRQFKGVPPYKATRYYVDKVFEYYYYYQASEV